MENEIFDVEQIVSEWGEEFRLFSKNRRVHFTGNEIYLDLKTSVKNLAGEDTMCIRIREPNVSELRMMDAVKGEVSKMSSMLEALIGISDAEMSKMKASDFVILSKVVGAFLADGPETGVMS